MIVKTYQSRAVLEILQQGQTYRARRNLGFDVAYQGLIRLLGLHCDAPIFGYLKGHRRCTNGKISSSVLLTLDVPAEYVYLTEYSVWADYMYCVMHYTLPTNRESVTANEEVTQRQFSLIMNDLKTQRSPSYYAVPQAVMEKIKPEWLIQVTDHTHSPFYRFWQALRGN
ncbi:MULTISPECIES: hypothetical protein [Caproicibacterium]|uniref:Uncharacterized protein n=1 Tax=Caproicibacterium argilliputei TaxID=3030016 RepID=A0AA97H254_9FIRM|nr:hypothetical protein [Caproicibacterium argilliputei]WOC33241.1 hypothetical protein PXC00_05025 [Caproicibacterium argilliputei]